VKLIFVYWLLPFSFIPGIYPSFVFLISASIRFISHFGFYGKPSLILLDSFWSFENKLSAFTNDSRYITGAKGTNSIQEQGENVKGILSQNRAKGRVF
jgi:hypothetical protein